jgi:hypothetical protein
VAERSGLLTRTGRNPCAGSNPAPSARHTPPHTERAMSKHSIRQEVDLKVIVSDNDLIIIETGANPAEGGVVPHKCSITINREECLCLADLLATATFELNRRKREDMKPAVTIKQPFPVKEIEL